MSFAVEPRPSRAPLLQPPPLIGIFAPALALRSATKVIEGRCRARTYLAQLAVLVPTPVNRRVDHGLVDLALAADTGAYTRQRFPPSEGNAIPAFLAFLATFTAIHAGPSSTDRVANRVFYLVLHRAIA